MLKCSNYETLSLPYASNVNVDDDGMQWSILRKLIDVDDINDLMLLNETSVIISDWILEAFGLVMEK